MSVYYNCDVNLDTLLEQENIVYVYMYFESQLIFILHFLNYVPYGTLFCICWTFGKKENASLEDVEMWT